MKEQITRVMVFILSLLLFFVMGAVPVSKTKTGIWEIDKDGNFQKQLSPEEIQDDKWGEDSELPEEIFKDILLNDFSVMVRTAQGLNPITISDRARRIVFQVHTTPWYSGNDLLYQYKMEGFDIEWNQHDAAMKQAIYTNLEPGEYTFRIKRSRNRDGKVVRSIERAVRIIIIPPFWATWWFRLLILTAFLGLVALFVKLRTNRAKKHKERELKLSQVQAQLSQAQLKALKAQLHPHFLFNTLNVISSLMHENVEAADDVITRLGDLLRLMFTNAGQQFVHLRNEMEFVSIYLELHKVRFQDKLDVTMDVPDNTLTARIPNLLIQPLVENAVIHGTSKEKKDNQIVLRVHQKEERLFIRIQDNGPGIPQLDTGDVMDIQQGFGLKSTLERLKIAYESDYTFKMENSLQGGLIVSIEIPYNE